MGQALADDEVDLGTESERQVPVTHELEHLQ